MFLHGSEALQASHDDPLTLSMTDTISPMARQPSLFVAFRSAASVMRDSVMVIVLVMAAALVLSTIEGIIESGRPNVVNAHAFLGIKEAEAAELKGYEALQVQVPSKVTMTPGETKTITVKMQNLGPKSWSNDGTGYVSVYTYSPKYRASVFKNASWPDPVQPAKLKETSVGVGSVGTIELSLTAPTTVGTYSETFNLAAEDVAWIPGGLFTVNITVAEPEKASTTKSTSKTSKTTTKVVETKSTYAAEVVAMSEPTITAKGGVSVVYTVTVKNTGSKSWGSRTLKPNTVRIAGVSTNDIEHKSWKSSAVVLERAGAIAPGESDTFSFAFLTPKYKGSYNLAFQLTVAGESIEGGEIDIPVDVTANAPGVKDAPLKNNEKKSSSKTKTTKAKGVYSENITTTEPVMRVGILIVDEETDDEVIISSESAMRIEDTDGDVLAEVKAGKKVKAYYKKNKYYYEIDGESEKIGKPIRFVPVVENAILTITNFDRKVTRGSAYSDNQFRNVLEIRYNDVKERVWLINELPMEWYLKGLAETSNASHQEFQKALITAARTYAYYHWQRNTKHDAEGFTVDAYADQVYKGYGQEVRTPNLSQAVDATRGVTVVYQGETAITAYFSRSDGRTRDWSDVWGGSVPWSKGVPVPCDKGKTLWGHGVGMSASGALCMANDGEAYDKILKYFYTGVDLEKRWK